MKYLSLIWAALFRSKTRTFLTLLSVVAAFLLFGMLDSVRVAFNSGGSVDGANRLVVASRLSITQMLPYSLTPQIDAIAGREEGRPTRRGSAASTRTRRTSSRTSRSAPNYFDLYREYDRAARPAARPGRPTAPARSSASRWRSVRLEGRRHHPAAGHDLPAAGRQQRLAAASSAASSTSRTDRSARAQENQLMFHWKYFDEANDYIKGQVGWYIGQAGQRRPGHARGAARSTRSRPTPTTRPRARPKRRSSRPSPSSSPTSA